MAGQLTIDTLKASTGVLATQNGMTGIAKAWVKFNGSTAVIGGSFNVGSVTKNGTGDYTVAYTTTMPDANYAITGAAVDLNGSGFVAVKNGTTPTTSSANIRVWATTGFYDPSICYMVVNGN